MIVHSTDCTGWLMSVVSHKCVGGRSFFPSDDTKQKQVGYECDSCGEQFRIRINDLKSTSTPAFMSSLAHRDDFGRKLGRWSRSLLEKSLMSTGLSMNAATSNTMVKHENVVSLKDGIITKIR